MHLYVEMDQVLMLSILLPPERTTAAPFSLLGDVGVAKGTGDMAGNGEI